MPEAPAGRDTIRILVSTDNHVGYNERDAIQGDDSAKTFDEIMSIAKEKTVDMVVLAGDLFHENKPSRKSLNQVMRSLRKYCFGEKPCELEMLSDPTEQFDATFDHVNYEDPDINVAIPVFSIHGNHDDPSGAGHLAALDLLQTCGLINYYGKTPESDNIAVKPVLLQKGRTKLALYGMSNVRDERLFRTFREGKVRFYRPGTQRENWFNLLSVHQNHHAYNETGYLPENFLPDFLDLVIWGHEHECLIEPKYNPEMSFHVMQPGSSVATSLVPGEAVEKHVAVLEITGEKFESTPIRLKTVRPFITKDIVLREEKGMKNLAKKDNNRPEITRHLMGIVEELISQARASWHAAQNEDHPATEETVPLPLVRLRVEYSALEGGRYDCENPQRFSNRFIGKVANVNDVIQFHKKKTGASRNPKAEVEQPAEASLAQLTLDKVKVEKLVREFLTAQSLTILPQNSFGDAVSQFVDKDDKHAMEMFVDESLTNQIKHLLEFDDAGEEDLAIEMGQYRSKLEELFNAGHLKRAKNARLKPKPAHWDSDLDGEWADQPGALILSDEPGEEQELDSEPQPAKSRTARGAGKSTANSGQRSAVQKPISSSKPSTSRAGRGNKSTVSSKRDHEDVIMIDDDNEDLQARARGSRSTAKANSKSSPSAAKKSSTRSTGASQTPARQSKLNFSQSGAQQLVQTNGKAQMLYELSDDEISDDDDDAFEPTPATTRSKTRR